EAWLVGEAVALLVVALPAQLLARWTRRDENLPARAALQVGIFAGLFGVCLPAYILWRTGGRISILASRPAWSMSLALQLLALAALPGLAAVQEFCERGRGTPFPYDPPRRLVASGPYAYVANPMQVSMTLLFLLAGALVASPWLAAAGLVSAAYAGGLAAWHEDAALLTRFGP